MAVSLAAVVALGASAVACPLSHHDVNGGLYAGAPPAEVFASVSEGATESRWNGPASLTIGRIGHAGVAGSTLWRSPVMPLEPTSSSAADTDDTGTRERSTAYQRPHDGGASAALPSLLDLGVGSTALVPTNEPGFERFHSAIGLGGYAEPDGTASLSTSSFGSSWPGTLWPGILRREHASDSGDPTSDGGLPPQIIPPPDIGPPAIGPPPDVAPEDPPPAPVPEPATVLLIGIGAGSFAARHLVGRCWTPGT